MSRANYVLSMLLLLVGLYGMLVRQHLVRKLMAMTIVQAAIIMFFVSLAAKRGADPPIATGPSPQARAYANPLPHTLMLTAIVVGVATTGVAFALLIRIHRRYGTLEEGELLRRMRG